MLKNFSDYSLYEIDFYLNKYYIDIWEIPINIQDISFLINFLSKEEKILSDRLYVMSCKKRFIITKSILRIILSLYLKQDFYRLQFIYGKRGKPYIINKHYLEFNLTHSKNLALLAIGTKYPIGIDIEYLKFRNYNKIAKRLFSLQELNFFIQAPIKKKIEIFFYIWTQKESFIKTCEEKFKHPIIRKLCIPDNYPTNTIIFDKKNKKIWKMISFIPKSLYISTICFSLKIKKINYRKINIYRLMKFI